MALYFPPLFVKLTVKGCSSPVLHYFKSLAKITKKNNGFAQKKKKKKVMCGLHSARCHGLDL